MIPPHSSAFRRRGAPRRWATLLLVCELSACGLFDQAYGGRTAHQWALQLHHADPARRIEAAKALGQIRPRNGDVVSELGAALRDSMGEVRRAAAQALRLLEERARVALPAVQTCAISDPDADVRMSCVALLGRTANINAGNVGVLARALLSDSTTSVRSTAGDALIQARDERAIPALAKALRDPEADVRSVAAAALGNFGKAAASAHNALSVAARDSNEMVRHHAMDALAAIDGHQRKH